ncbi:hypothetical protein EB001_27200, partial [bacterium]|nr:hypothetical protein [bacterium]
DPKNFKSYEELKRRLDDVLGFTGSQPTPRAAVVEDDEVPFKNSKPTSSPAPSSVKKAPVVEEEEDEDLAMFRKLAED